MAYRDSNYLVRTSNDTHGSRSSLDIYKPLPSAVSILPCAQPHRPRWLE